MNKINLLDNLNELTDFGIYFQATKIKCKDSIMYTCTI